MPRKQVSAAKKSEKKAGEKAKTATTDSKRGRRAERRPTPSTSTRVCSSLHCELENMYDYGLKQIDFEPNLLQHSCFAM